MTDKRAYQVGYGKPPEYTQFKKGQPSPNPKGRPRRKSKPASLSPDEQSEADRLFLAKLAEKVLVRDANAQGTQCADDRSKI